jgi:butyryl-CoA:acetate CoA-transferase
MPLTPLADQLRQKLCTADEAARAVKSGDTVFLGEFAQNIDAFDVALAKRRAELREVQLITTTRTRALACVEADPRRESFVWNDWHYSGLVRRFSDKGQASYIPMTYHQAPRIIDQYAPVDVVAVQVTPMDRHGYFNLSTSCSMTPAYLQKARTVIVEVNTRTPRCLGGLGESIHLSSVHHVIEGPNKPLFELPPAPEGPVDGRIAAHVLSLMEDGATIQLGIGGLPNTVGALIAKSDLKDLGVHTEMLADAYLDMFEAGQVTNRRKTLERGKMTYTFAMGSQRLYDFLDDNPGCSIHPVSYTNDPEVICKNDKVIAINNAVEVDLFTQVASESSGPRQISGTGGQLDFIFGAFKSTGGKGLICLSSTFKKKDGTLGSRIVPSFSAGTIVTCPRTIVHYVITEYGIAQLKGKSTWQRAEAIIGIAHPDFRDELVKQAEALGIWRNVNRS